MNLYTQSVEDATIVLTNCGSGSDEALLAYRDLRVYGLNVATGTTTLTIHMDFGTAITADYILFGNVTSGGDDQFYDVDYSDNDTNWTTWINNGEFTGLTNANHFTSGSSVSHRYWRVIIDRSAGGLQSLTMSCIFIGATYSFPVNYQYNNGRFTQQRTEMNTDIFGYPYGQAINSSKKYIWDLVFNMTKTQLANLESQLEIVDYNLKPFFLYDSNIDSVYHLVHFPYNRLDASHQAYEYYNVPFYVEEL